MTSAELAGGTFTLADDLTLTRVGYGAMQLAGPHVFGPPADRDGALAVLRAVVDLGINHLDTADFYGPHITDQLIREALQPYPQDLRIVTTLGALRDAEGGWPQARAPQRLRAAVHAILLIPGTSSVAHLKENVAGAALTLPPEAVKQLNDIAA